MSYLQLVIIHLATVLPAFAIATYLLLSRKGTPKHKMLGKLYMILMLATAAVSLFMPAKVGPVFMNHFGYIHLLSLLTLYTVPVAYLAARRKNIKRHRNAMIALYVGGFLVAGYFAMMPGRLLHSWLFA